MWTLFDLPAWFRSVVIAAHPDDEVIGLGSLLPEWRGRVHIIHVTDGAPDDMEFARRSGFHDNEAYAAARRTEAEQALHLAGVPPGCIVRLGYKDRGTAAQLVALTRDIATTLRQLRPDAVFTHPYEGGHIDHDSTAFAVRNAIGILPQARLLEFTSYHADGSELVTSRFLPYPGAIHSCRRLTPEQQSTKRRMLECFQSQQHFLHNFSLEQECVRMAPCYDFTRPPHPGLLHYELTGPANRSAEWRRQAMEAGALLKASNV